jgi:hypothetical protein
MIDAIASIIGLSNLKYGTIGATIVVHRLTRMAAGVGSLVAFMHSGVFGRDAGLSSSIRSA